MSSKYKSPLIRSSRNASPTAAVAADDGPSPNAVASTPLQSLATVVRSGCPAADDRPQQSPVGQRNFWRGRGCSSPRFNGTPWPPRGSSYQWTPPASRFNNSWSSDVMTVFPPLPLRLSNSVVVFVFLRSRATPAVTRHKSETVVRRTNRTTASTRNKTPAIGIMKIAMKVIFIHQCWKILGRHYLIVLLPTLLNKMFLSPMVFFIKRSQE